ncbi:MAG: class I SAM-dependent methyltransferase [Methanobacterium sp.]
MIYTTELFIPPPTIQLNKDGYHGAASYSDYNYLKPGLFQKIKRRHFEIALNLTKKYFHKANVIDIGCADGPFIPSLSKYFNQVAGIEYDPRFVEQARKAVYKQHLENVSVLCNKESSFEEIRKGLGNTHYSIIFLMEVLEHVGQHWTTMYQDKVKFLKEAATFLDNDGIIVISVPKMTGFSFLFQVVGQVLFNLGNKKEILSLPVTSLLKCVFLNDTDEIEPLWRPFYTHMGFSHLKFEMAIKSEFKIIKSKNDWFQKIYMVELKHD